MARLWPVRPECEGPEDLVAELRRQDISDDAVLDAVMAVPRPLFVGSNLKLYAWENRALPIGSGQTISQPFIVAYMTEKLALKPHHNVLEIGTGSGYQAAILSRLCRHVFTIERYKSLLVEAMERFKSLGLENISAKWGDGALGWPEHAPYDRIIITAGGPEIPAPLYGQLATDGFILAPIGDDEMQWVERITPSDDAPSDPKSFESEQLIPVRFVPLQANHVE